jgi:hypothetical protein
VISGKRESAVDDIAWGAFQMAFVYWDWTNRQAIGTAWILFLLTVIEDAWLNPNLSKEEKWRKASWIGVVAIGTGKLLFF